MASTPPEFTFEFRQRKSRRAYPKHGDDMFFPKIHTVRQIGVPTIRRLPDLEAAVLLTPYAYKPKRRSPPPEERIPTLRNETCTDVACNSLDNIIEINYPRYKLLERPIFWRSYHAEALRAAFVKRSTQYKHFPRNATQRTIDELENHNYSNEFFEIFNLHFKGLASRYRLPFYFRRKVKDYLVVDDVYAYDSHSGPASVAAIDMNDIRRRRPPDRYEDPYIIAVLIALAQGQRNYEQLRQDISDR
ncbi:hypothetical protein QBC43DRAFT_283141 [Cladorrhinum sp. PSN259]|nr:hypothetical protein QBC43DRAFT_283141 [Cladorrhinum sp. PSN259]